MKNILSLFFIFLASNICAQTGYENFAKLFYSKIDSSHKLVCCDSNHYGFSLIYEIPLMEIPYDELDLKDFEIINSEDSYVEMYVDDLVHFYEKIKPSTRDKITKSCYTLNVDYNINKDVTRDGLYWVDGTLKIKVFFQADDKNFFLPWWKKILCRFR